jgi:hypothetical protein
MKSEINLNEEFGYEIYQTVIKYNLICNLEIGSWDGEGSTHCFVEAMKLLCGHKKLICLEIDSQKFQVLKNRYKHIDFVYPIQNSSISYNEMVFKNFEEIWNSPMNKIDKNLSSKELVESWFNKDISLLKNIEKGSLIDLKNYYWDSVLIDGGEFTGYSEFLLLKDKTNVFFLDDVHKAFKCYQIYKELKENNNWTLLKENKNTRNGYAIFKKNKKI